MTSREKGRVVSGEVGAKEERRAFNVSGLFWTPQGRGITSLRTERARLTQLPVCSHSTPGKLR